MAHTKWMCKYHIVFTPKYRRKVIYNQYKEDIRDIIKILCKYKGVEIIEGHLMPDHIHMLVSIPPKYSISQFMGYLKGKSALMIYDKHANCYCSLVPRSSNGFCRCFALQIGKICCHHCIIRHFQFRKCLPVNSNSLRAYHISLMHFFLLNIP